MKKIILGLTILLAIVAVSCTDKKKEEQKVLDAQVEKVEKAVSETDKLTDELEKEAKELEAELDKI